MYEILQKVHRHTLKSQRLTVALPSPPRLALRNVKTLKDHLVRSKLKTTYEKPGVAIYYIKEIHLKVRILVNFVKSSMFVLL